MIKVFILTIVFSTHNTHFTAGLTSQQYYYPTKLACAHAQNRWVAKPIKLRVATCEESYIVK